MDTDIYLKVGYVVLDEGIPVKTGLRRSKTSKLYRHAGMARRVAARQHPEPAMVAEAFIKVPGE